MQRGSEQASWWVRLWDRAVFEREDPTALGVCRALLVFVLTLSLLAHTGAVADYFSDASVVSGEFAREAFPSRWSLFFHVTSPFFVRCVFAVGVVAHILWMVGLWTVPASLVALGVWISMVGRNPLLYSLPDQLQMALASLLAAMPAGRGFSVDACLRGRGGPVPVWCRRLIQLQLAVVYTSTGLLKSGDSWKDGTAIYYALVSPYNRHFDATAFLAAIQPWVLRPLTWLVLIWEVGFGGFVAVHWVREAWPRAGKLPDLRRPFLGFGVAMHLGIQAMLYVAWFSPLCIVSYASFLSSAEAKTVVLRVASRLRRWGILPAA